MQGRRGGRGWKMRKQSMARLAAAALAAVFAGAVDGQYSQQWEAPISGQGAQSDQGMSIAVDAFGNSYVCLQYYASPSRSLYRIVSYTGAGAFRWTHTYNPFPTILTATHIPRHIMIDDTDAEQKNWRVYVTGESPGADGTPEIATLKLVALTGALDWAARYANVDYPAGKDVGRFVHVAPDTKDVYVCGYSEGNGTGKDSILLKYTPNGIPSADWPYVSPAEPAGARRYHNIAEDEAVMLVTGHAINPLDAIPQDWVCIAGTSDGAGTGKDIVAVLYDDSNGIRAWSNPDHYRYDHWGLADWCVALFKAGDGDETLILAGTSQHHYPTDDPMVPLSYDFVVLGVDVATRLAPMPWVTSERRYDSSANDVCTAAAVPVGSGPAPETITLVGYSAVTGQADNFRWARWNVADGSFQWTGHADGSANRQDWALAVAVDGKGRGYMTGRGYQSVGQWDYMTLRIKAEDGALYLTGNPPDWPQFYAGSAGGNDTANSIVAELAHVPHNDVWVTGGAVRTNTGLDCMTVKYHYNSP